MHCVQVGPTAAKHHCWPWMLQPTHDVPRALCPPPCMVQASAAGQGGAGQVGRKQSQVGLALVQRWVPLRSMQEICCFAPAWQVSIYTHCTHTCIKWHALVPVLHLPCMLSTTAPRQLHAKSGSQLNVKGRSPLQHGYIGHQQRATPQQARHHDTSSVR